MPVPDDLQPQGICVHHFLRKVEEACNDLKRETIQALPGERTVQIRGKIAEFGELLIRLSLSGARLADDQKMGILNAVLALINLRESMERASAAREAALRKATGR